MISDSPVFKRILLKLSGEALMGTDSHGINPDMLGFVASEIKSVVDIGVQVSIVIGGGNIFRGASLAVDGMGRVTGDHIGMLATVINSLAMHEAIEKLGMQSRVMSAVSINGMCEDYICQRAVRHLEKGRVAIFAAGTGNPFFTTDSAASLRAIEIGANILIKATKVDGIYSADPVKNPEATRFMRVSFDEALEKKLEVMDTTAIVLCRDNNLPLRVMDINEKGALHSLVRGHEIGTLVA